MFRDILTLQVRGDPPLQVEEFKCLEVQQPL